MIGTGLTPEGINQNYMMYDIMNEMGTYINNSLTSSQALDWVESYCTRRYGAHNDAVVKAWRLLGNTVYNCTDGRNDLRVSVVTNLPSFGISPHVWFSPEDLYQAWDLMVSVGDTFTKMETFRCVNDECSNHNVQYWALNSITLYYTRGGVWFFQDFSRWRDAGLKKQAQDSNSA